MSKKKVTAPLTYDPGKGRPKEHLAYLNYQEMQALKRLNGNNQERGPKGIPSFPPADAAGSSSKASSTTRTSGPSSSLNAPARTAPSSSVSRPSTTTASRGPSSSLNAPARTAPSSSVSRPSGSGFSGIGGGGGGGARDSGQATARNVTTSRSVTPGRASSTPSGGGGRDSGIIRQTQISNTKAAEKTPALRDDRSRTLNVGPMGTPVQVRAQQGARISGAIRQAQAPAVRPTTPMATQGTSFASPLDARIENRFRISDARRASDQFRFSEVPSVAEIAADNARRLNAARMAQQYSQYRSPPSVSPPAPQGVFGPRSGAGTGYLRTAEAPGMITTGMPSALSSSPRPRFNAEETLRAYEEAKRIANVKPIQDRILPSKFYGAEDRVPAEPRLTVGRSAVVPSAPPRAPTYGRGTTVPSYPTSRIEDGLYKKPGRDSAVERALAEAGFDPSGRRLQALIDPSIPGRAAAGQERILEISTIEDPSLLRAYSGITSPGTYAALGSEIQREMLENLERMATRTRGIGSLVPEEAVPGYGVDVNNIPRVRVITNTEVPSSPYSGYGTFNVPDIDSPVIQGAPSSGKLFTDPFEDRVPFYDISGSPLNPSVVGDVDGGSVAYKMTDVIDPPPSSLPRGEPPMRFVGDDGKEYFITREQFERLSQEDKNKLAEQYARQDQIAPPKPRERPADLMDAYPDLGYPGPDKPTSEDISEALGEGDTGSNTEGYLDPSKALPRYVSPEAQEEMKRQERANKAGVSVIASRNPLVALLNAGTRLFTGETIAGSNAALKRQYMQSSPEQQAALEKQYPNLTKFASDIGLTPQLPMKNYTDWAEKSGLRGSPSREGGSSGILALERSRRDTDEEGGDTGGETGGDTTSGGRPAIYYMWDLGVNIPSPGAPNYTQYQTYLAERLAAQQAMGYV